MLVSGNSHSCFLWFHVDLDLIRGETPSSIRAPLFVIAGEWGDIETEFPQSLQPAVPEQQASPISKIAEQHLKI